MIRQNLGNVDAMTQRGCGGEFQLHDWSARPRTALSHQRYQASKTNCCRFGSTTH